MILNNADNIMFEDSEVSKVYCGDAVVWERNVMPDIPPEVQACIDYYHENYAPEVDIEDIGYIYGLTYNSGTQQFEYNALVLYPMTETPFLHCGGYSASNVALWNAQNYQNPLYNNIINAYQLMWSTAPNGENDPIELYGNFPQIDKYEGSFRLNYTYRG